MTIRRATLQDSELIATHMLLAMEEIVYQFIGERDFNKAMAFMLYFASRANNQYSYQNCWVAEEEQEVVATVNLYDGAQLIELRKPVVAYIKNLHQQGFKPEDETGPGEYYIDTIGVTPKHQGKGIGFKVLQFLIEEYVIKQGQTLGLLVDKENPNAKRLYLRMGFQSVGMKMVFGKQMEHLQISNQVCAENRN